MCVFFFRELKEEAKSRLSGICTDITQKEENRNRLISTVNRLHKQNSGIREEIASLNNRNMALKEKAQELVANVNSENILAAAELGDTQVSNVELRNQVSFIKSRYNGKVIKF